VLMLPFERNHVGFLPRLTTRANSLLPGTGKFPTLEDQG
jgi:hypothetical protein